MFETLPPHTSGLQLRDEARRRIQAVVDWLMEQRLHTLRSTLVFDGVCRKLADCGISLDRASLHARQLHPQFAARSIVWERQAGGAVELGRRHGTHLDPGYLKSPIRAIHTGLPVVRRRIGDPGCPMDFPVLTDLRAQGYSDYLMAPVHFSGGVANAISFATKQPEGFPELDTAMLHAVLPALGTIMELDFMRRTARGLLQTYLGPSAGERVLSGTIKRGDGEVINAVIWFCDLRNFTALSEALPLDQVLGVLNDYFDEICRQVVAQGGEVLKFIGDAILAIFPISGAVDDRARACTAAIEAAQAAFAGLGLRSKQRVESGLPAIRCGVALHIGDVLYGNVGAADRLDFTVTGPAVNLAARLEGLSPGLRQPLVLSADFARLCGHECRSLGIHELKGVVRPQEAFTLA